MATLIVALGEIWEWDFPIEAIAATICAVDYFMGRILKISSNQYYEHLEEMANLDIPEEEEEKGEEGIG